MKSYNITYHQSLGRPPASVDNENEAESRFEQYLLRKKTVTSKNPARYKFKIGQTVRVSHLKNIFDREYSQKWTGELFKIRRKFRRAGLPLYRLEDWSGDDIEGTFYQQELQAVTVDENTVYRVDKILQRRKRNNQREVLVRWLHWPRKYDSWITENEVQNYSL